jgi:hypothetical protein
LENITDCGVIGRAHGLANRSLPGIYVDTASGGQGRAREATGIALAGQERFMQVILDQRDTVKGRAVRTPVVTAMVAYPVMERGAERPTAERIKEITALYESGVLTKDEFLTRSDKKSLTRFDTRPHQREKEKQAWQLSRTYTISCE